MASRPTIRTSTQEHLDLYDIDENIAILKDGSACLVLSATAINFDLLSEEEQEAIIYAYAAILNSLTYPIQILIHSERKDISDYLRIIKIQEDTQGDKILKEHIRKYRRFVEETVKRNNVLDKKFYIALVFTAIELGAAQAGLSALKKPKKLPFPKDYIIKQAHNSLLPKRDHLVREFVRLGIRLHQLTTPELIELFYRSYNPNLSTGQKFDTPKNYSTTIVQGPAQMTSQLRHKIDQFNTTTSTNELPVTEPPAPRTPATPASSQLAPSGLASQTQDGSASPPAPPVQSQAGPPNPTVSGAPNGTVTPPPAPPPPPTS